MPAPIPPGERGVINAKEKGRGRWFVGFRYRDFDGGEHRQKDMGPYGSKRDAENAAYERWDAIRAEMEKADKAARPGFTLDEIAESWLEWLPTRNTKPGTVRSYRKTWRSTLSPACGSMNVNDLTRATAVKILENLCRRAPGRRDEDGTWVPGEYLVDENGQRIPVTGTQPRAVLMQVLNYAADKGLREDGANVLFGTTAPPKKKYEPRAITDREFETLYDLLVADATGHQRTNWDLHDFALVGHFTGCRTGEILGLTWDRLHLDADMPWMLVDRQLPEEWAAWVDAPEEVLAPTKADDKAKYRLHPELATVLTRRKERSQWTRPGDPVFAVPETRPGTGRTGRPTWLRHSNVRTKLRRVVEGTAVAWIHPHSFKHTLATLAAEQHDIETAAWMSRHHDGGRVAKSNYVERRTVRLIDPRHLFDPQQEDATVTPLDQKRRHEG
ncbi:site-specific integrase [Nocardioides sp. KR10-350]|uniref:site-specific integrase n=1 Tax=Nocardioides cheoyonin TaxID=3156615 RepID=UPI0032B3F435